MSFSFCLCVHNEGFQYLNKCISCIKAAMSYDDELIVVDDFSTEPSTVAFLSTLECKKYQHALNKNFAEHKNFLISKATKDYVFLFDADEYIEPIMIINIKQYVENHQEADAFALPRMNILLNSDDATIKRMNWRIEDGLFNYPDHQVRIWKNHKGITYNGKLHELVSGYQRLILFPTKCGYDIMHIKTQDRQLQQHYFYETIR